MYKAFKTLISKFINLLINFKKYPVLTSKYILKYLFVRYIYRTITWILFTALLGNSFFDQDIIESIKNTLNWLWGNLKQFTLNCTVFVEHHIRSFISWLTNRDYSKKPDNDSSIYPVVNNPINSNSNPIPKNPGATGSSSKFPDYESIWRKNDEEWKARMREAHPTTRNPWFNIKLPDDSTSWILYGAGGIALAALGYGIYSNWENISSFLPHPHSFSDFLSGIKKTGSSVFTYVYTLGEYTWRHLPWTGGNPSPVPLSPGHLERAMEELRIMKERLDQEREITLNDTRSGLHSPAESTHSALSNLNAADLNKINPFNNEDATSGPSNSVVSPKPDLTVNTQVNPQTDPTNSPILTALAQKNPNPFNTSADVTPTIPKTNQGFPVSTLEGPTVETGGDVNPSSLKEDKGKRPLTRRHWMDQPSPEEESPTNTRFPWRRRSPSSTINSWGIESSSKSSSDTIWGTATLTPDNLFTAFKETTSVEGKPGYKTFEGAVGGEMDKISVLQRIDNGKIFRYDASGSILMEIDEKDYYYNSVMKNLRNKK